MHKNDFLRLFLSYSDVQSLCFIWCTLNSPPTFEVVVEAYFHEGSLEAGIYRRTLEAGFLCQLARGQQRGKVRTGRQAEHFILHRKRKNT